VTEQIGYYRDLSKLDDQTLDQLLRDLPTSFLISHVSILQAALVVAGSFGSATVLKVCRAKLGVDRLLPAFHREIDRRLPRPE